MKVRNISLVLLLMFFAFSGCKSKKEEQPQAETIKFVKVETIDEGATQNKITLNGKVKEKSLTTLSFRVGGPLSKLNVKQGDFVRAGQIIAEIDFRDYELQVQSTKAQYDQVKGEYERYKKLIEQNKIPENTFEKVESGYLMAKTAYENAQNQLKDTKLKAPFSGYVYEKDAENYQTVGAGTPIVSLIDNSRLEAVMPVSESQLQRVKKAKEYLLSVDNANVKNQPVQLQSISEKTMSDGLFQAKFTFSNSKDTKVTPGMTADITIMCNVNDSQLIIPTSAVFHEGTSSYVWIFNSSSGTVSKKAVSVELGGGNGEMIIKSGLTGGEQIVTAGVNYLVEGQKVKPIESPSATNEGGLL
jgi:RND family efflux transporter MFP subunit